MGVVKGEKHSFINDISLLKIEIWGYFEVARFKYRRLVWFRNILRGLNILRGKNVNIWNENPWKSPIHCLNKELQTLDTRFYPLRILSYQTSIFVTSYLEISLVSNLRKEVSFYESILFHPLQVDFTQLEYFWIIPNVDIRNNSYHCMKQCFFTP